MGRIETHCSVCGKTIYRWPYQIRDFSPMCSAECRVQSRLGVSSPNALCLEGQRFGKLLVIERVGMRKGHALWRCQCECGHEHLATSLALKHGHVKSCGCSRFTRNNGSIDWKRGKEHPNWRKGETITADGYREVPIFGCKGHHRYRSEHRTIVERAIGRELSKHEVVHHINENKLDNRPENLSVLTRSEHASLHAAMRKGVPSHILVVSISEIAKGNVNKGNGQ